MRLAGAQAPCQYISAFKPQSFYRTPLHRRFRPEIIFCFPVLYCHVSYQSHPRLQSSFNQGIRIRSQTILAQFGLVYTEWQKTRFWNTIYRIFVCVSSVVSRRQFFTKVLLRYEHLCFQMYFYFSRLAAGHSQVFPGKSTEQPKSMTKSHFVQ